MYIDQYTHTTHKMRRVYVDNCLYIIKNKNIMRLVFSMTLFVLAISSCVSAFKPTKPPIEWSGTSYPLLVDPQVDRINLGAVRTQGNSWRVEGPKNSTFTIYGSSLVLSQIRRVSGVTTETSFAKFGAYTVTEFETASGTTVGTRSLHLVGKDSFRGVWIDTIRGNTEVALDLACLKLIDAALTRDPNWVYAGLNSASDYVPLKYAIGLVSTRTDTGSCPPTGSLWGAVWSKAYYPLYKHGGFHRHDLSVWGTHLEPKIETIGYDLDPMQHVEHERANVDGVEEFIFTILSTRDRESGRLTEYAFGHLMYYTGADVGYVTDIVAELMDTDGSGNISISYPDEVPKLLTALESYDALVERFTTVDANRDGMLTLSDLQRDHRNGGLLMTIVANVRECLGMPSHDDIIVSREEYVRLRIPGCSKRATNAFAGAVPGANMPIELFTTSVAVRIMKDAVLTNGPLSLTNFTAKLRDMGVDDFPADVLFVMLDIDHSGYLELGEVQGTREAFMSYRALWEEFKSVDADRDGVVTYTDVVGASALMLSLLADVRAALGLPVLHNRYTMLIWDEFVRLSIPDCPLTRKSIRNPDQTDLY
jgi:hypothetical protein